MNTRRRLFCTVAASVAAAPVLVGCGNDATSTTDSSSTTTAGTSVSTPTPGPDKTTPPKPTQRPTAYKTVTVSVPATPPTTAKPTSTPAVKPSVKPVRPNGRTITVVSHEYGTGDLPRYVRVDPQFLPEEHRLICAGDVSTWIPLQLNGTVPTDKDGTNFVSTLVTTAGLLVFPQKGSVLPSDTLIAGESLYGKVPEANWRDTILLSSASNKGGWGKIGNNQLGICDPR
ncbi:MAG TPA: hypothetical protein VK497_04915 [Candidatus Saccharimonadales bacterium]|nr:hypothetical protein [Candidatus Saccharimonadales bacterium]